ncbi:MAG: hypothetical protein HY791_03345 [Deltaproteobacteria bacterium]|nr:hypothetical protein [Deltaproteobacteria bacterium]
MNAMTNKLARWLGVSRPQLQVLVRPLRSSRRLMGLAARATLRVTELLESRDVTATQISDNMTSIAPGTYLLEGALEHLSGDLTLTLSFTEATSRAVLIETQIRVSEDEVGCAELLAEGVRDQVRRALFGEKARTRTSSRPRSRISA